MKELDPESFKPNGEYGAMPLMAFLE